MSNADSDNRTSKSLAKAMADRIPNVPTGRRLQANVSGKRFEEACRDFLRDTFLQLGHIRPGDWRVLRVGSDIGKVQAAENYQYVHLNELQRLASQNNEIKTALGSDYIVAPDVVILREPAPDAVINQNKVLAGKDVATRSALRARFQSDPVMHGCISCKWTMRSDRAQNTRTEALNLMRNRKGHTPHIVAVTAEPLPSRISSLALGTEILIVSTTSP